MCHITGIHTPSEPWETAASRSSGRRSAQIVEVHRSLVALLQR